MAVEKRSGDGDPRGIYSYISNTFYGDYLSESVLRREP